MKFQALKFYLPDILSCGFQISSWYLFVGFGLQADLQMLVKSFPDIKTAMLDMTRVVDLDLLAKMVSCMVLYFSQLDYGIF